MPTGRLAALIAARQSDLAIEFSSQWRPLITHEEDGPTIKAGTPRWGHRPRVTPGAESALLSLRWGSAERVMLPTFGRRPSDHSSLAAVSITSWTARLAVRPSSPSESCTDTPLVKAERTATAWSLSSG